MASISKSHWASRMGEGEDEDGSRKVMNKALLTWGHGARMTPGSYNCKASTKKDSVKSPSHCDHFQHDQKSSSKDDSL